MFTWFIGTGAHTLFKYFLTQCFRHTASLIGNFDDHVIPFIAQIELYDIVALLGAQARFECIIKQIANNCCKL